MIAIINKPDYYEGDKIVTLTAKVKSGEVEKTKQFKVLVKCAERTPYQSIIEDLNNINIPDVVTSDLDFRPIGECGSKLTWTSSNTSTIDLEGKVVRPAYGSEDATVQITVTATKGNESAQKIINVSVPAWTTVDEVTSAAKYITWALVRNLNTDIEKVTADLILPKVIGNEIQVEWESSNPTYLSNDGKVTRPQYSKGDVMCSLTATLSKNNTTTKAPINGINILCQDATNADRVTKYINNFDYTQYIAPSTSLEALKNSFNLPSIYGDIKLNYETVNDSGEVTPNGNVTLTEDEVLKQWTVQVTRPSVGQSPVECKIRITGTIPETTTETETIPAVSYNRTDKMVILPLEE